MPFADAADRGVARHLSERFDIVCEQKRLRAHTGGGKRGFRAGVSAADDDDIVGFGVNHVGHVCIAYRFFRRHSKQDAV